MRNQSLRLWSFKFSVVSNTGSLFEHRTHTHCKFIGLAFPHIICVYGVTYRMLLV